MHPLKTICLTPIGAVVTPYPTNADGSPQLTEGSEKSRAELWREIRVAYRGLNAADQANFVGWIVAPHQAMTWPVWGRTCETQIETSTQTAIVGVAGSSSCLWPRSQWETVVSAVPEATVSFTTPDTSGHFFQTESIRPGAQSRRRPNHTTVPIQPP